MGGQEKYRSMTPLYYRGAYAAIIVYDVTDPKSYDGALSWIEEVRQFEGSKIQIALVANKLDLAAAHRQIEAQTATDFAEEHRYIFREVSAKTGAGIRELFLDIGRTIPLNVNPSNKSDLGSIEFISDDDTSASKSD